MIGFPNVGKSTIISKISAAKPKIADYPFTTLVPNLGVVNVYEDSFVVADIPGLIKGAHSGIGLGDRFLKHVLRSKLIVYVLDYSVFLNVDNSSKGKKNLIETFKILQNELKLYDYSLFKKPYFVLINKIDLVDLKNNENLQSLNNLISEVKKIAKSEVLYISAVLGTNINSFVDLMHSKVLEIRQLEEKSEDTNELYRVYSPETFLSKDKNKINLNKLEIVKVGSEYVIKNKDLERLIAMTDLENEEALNYLKERLKKIGIGDKLKKMGVNQGSTVIIGNLVFELQE